MAGKHTFRAVIQQAGGGGAFVEVPFDVEAAFGKKRVQIVADIDGEPYRGSLVRMGGDCHMLIVLKEIRAKIGKQAGDEVEVTVEEDKAPRVVEIPPDFAAALRAEPEVRTFFQSLAYTHQREYVKAIEDAKRAETRQSRIAKTMVKLREKKKPE
jgi:bifunctional DNA-binding transcriptional regulator/antitoxin component of YhaV-PrlF toxin-antitoxin module